MVCTVQHNDHLVYCMVRCVAACHCTCVWCEQHSTAQHSTAQDRTAQVRWPTRCSADLLDATVSCREMIELVPTTIYLTGEWKSTLIHWYDCRRVGTVCVVPQSGAIGSTLITAACWAALRCVAHCGRSMPVPLIHNATHASTQRIQDRYYVNIT